MTLKFLDNYIYKVSTWWYYKIELHLNKLNFNMIIKSNRIRLLMLKGKYIKD